MKNDQRLFFTVMVLSVILGAGAGIISSTFTSRAIESYAAVLLNDQRYLSLIPRKSPSLPGTFDDAMKVNREASLRSLVTLLPHAEESVVAAGWVFPRGDLHLGIPVTSDGWVLTTSSAFSSAAGVKDFDAYVQGRRYTIDRVVRDPHSVLVLLKLANASGLPTVSFGKPEDVVSGSTLVGWGAPEGVSATVLSAADAELKFGAAPAEEFTTTWETAQAFTPGEPIFSASGDLLGFALSGSTVFPLHHSGDFVQDVLKTGTPKLAKLGASVLDLSRAYNVSSTLTQGRSEGAYVVSVTSGSPAATGGLLASDIILDVDGRAVSHAETLSEALADYDPGEIANIRVLRAGATLELVVTLGEL
jgi:serine protease Do